MKACILVQESMETSAALKEHLSGPTGTGDDSPVVACFRTFGEADLTLLVEFDDLDGLDRYIEQLRTKLGDAQIEVLPEMVVA